jgi:hypothetical protein
MRQNLARAKDRRVRQRFSLNAPLLVIAGDREIPAYTRDLSNLGVYFYLGSDDIGLVDRDFDFTLELPPEITLSTCCLIQCRGRTVRMETGLRDLTGLPRRFSIIRLSGSRRLALRAYAFQGCDGRPASS